MRLKINRMFPARHAIRKQRTCSYGMKAEQEPVGEQWSDGRVARQRSAKPCTAVRIRFRPHQNTVTSNCNGVLFLVCHTFVMQLIILGEMRLQIGGLYSENHSNLNYVFRGYRYR